MAGGRHIMSLFIMENKGIDLCGAHTEQGDDDEGSSITKLLIISKVRIKSVVSSSPPLAYYLYLLSGNNTYFASRTKKERKQAKSFFPSFQSSIDATFRQQGFLTHVDPPRTDAN